MLVVGLTGIIGSGKSTVANMLSEQGASVIDVDRIGHTVLDDGDIKIKLQQEFGREIIDENGNVSRKMLGDIVFKDKAKIKKLNALLHPKMIQIVEQKIQERKQSDIAYIIVEAALLFEMGLQKQVDFSVTVTAPEEVCIERVHIRNNLPREHIASRMKFQLSDQEKRERADIIIENDGALNELNQKVHKVHNWLLSRSDMNMA